MRAAKQSNQRCERELHTQDRLMRHSNLPDLLERALLQLPYSLALSPLPHGSPPGCVPLQAGRSPELTCIVFSDAHARNFDALACIPPIAHQSKSAQTLKDPRALCVACDVKRITARCGRTSQAVRRRRRRRGNCSTWRPLPCARAVLRAFWPRPLRPSFPSPGPGRTR